MITREQVNRTTAAALALAILCAPAHALVNLNDGRDRINVTATAGASWDSNVFANSDARSDRTVNTSIVAEYTRRAGWIGVNATAAINSARYELFRSEDFNNPSLNLELTKQTGRTTGSLTISAARQSRADAAVNVRSTSWNYSTGLNYRYPIVGLYTLSGHFGYSLVDYTDNSSGFPNLATYSTSVDLIRVLTSDRDLSLGYRYRRNETSTTDNSDDHAFTAGLSGRLIYGLMGSLRAGYQTRVHHGLDSLGLSTPRSESWTASGAATYAMNKRTNFTASLGKDFSTTANDISVDTSTASVSMDFAYNAHVTLNTSITGGDSRFLGNAGRIVVSAGPPLAFGEARHDQFLTGAVSLSYTLNQHLRASLSYTWFKNWSNATFAEFVRNTYDLSVSSGW